jgi:hypothetical protein
MMNLHNEGNDKVNFIVPFYVVARKVINCSFLFNSSGVCV